MIQSTDKAAASRWLFQRRREDLMGLSYFNMLYWYAGEVDIKDQDLYNDLQGVCRFLTNAKHG
jgi:hypothetical protein